MGVSTSHYSLCWLNEIPSLQFLFLSTHLLSRRYPHNIKNLPCSHQAGDAHQFARLKTCFFLSLWCLYVCQTISGKISGVKYDQNIENEECVWARLLFFILDCFLGKQIIQKRRTVFSYYHLIKLYVVGRLSRVR